MREVLESRMRPMIPDSCQSKLKFSECALHFAVMAQKILKVSEEMMPKGELVLYICMNKINQLKGGWLDKQTSCYMKISIKLNCYFQCCIYSFRS